MFTDSGTQSIKKINIVDDPRIRRCSSTINGKTYGYLLAEPEGGFTRTVFLIHGFPDLSSAWRNQIPLFLKFGFRVVCPDCIGYGRSDAPTGSIIPYTFKSHADDFVQLAKQLNCENIIVGGHDWGAVIAYRCALYYPDFITHLFTFVIPYIAPSFKWVETDVLVNRFPSLGYQLQFGSDDGVIESFTREKAGIRAFLNALYGGTSPAGKYAMDVTKGVDLELAPKLQHTRLVSPEELDFYVEEFARNGLPCNYYRNRKQNFEDELVFKDKPDAAFITCPTLFIRSVDDAIVTSVMVASMGTMVPNLTLKDVKAGHWILWQKPVEVNDILTGWMRQQGLVAEDTFGHL